MKLKTHKLSGEIDQLKQLLDEKNEENNDLLRRLALVHQEKG